MNRVILALTAAILFLTASGAQPLWAQGRQPGPSATPLGRLVMANQRFEAYKFFRADMTVRMFTEEGEPFEMAVTGGIWAADGRSMLPVNVNLLGQQTTATIYRTSAQVFVDVTSTVGGERTLVQGAPAALRRIGFPDDEFNRLARQLNNYLDRKRDGLFYVFRVTLTDGHQQYEAMSEEGARARVAALQQAYQKQMQRHQKQLENYRNLPQAERKLVRKPEPPEQPAVERFAPTGFDYIELAEAAAKNIDTAVNIEPDPISLESLLKRFALKPNVQLGEAAGKIDGTVGFRVMLTGRRDASGPIDYYIDSNGAIRGIDRFGRDGAKLLELRIANFNGFDFDPQRGLFEYERGGGDTAPRVNLADLIDTP